MEALTAEEAYGLLRRSLALVPASEALRPPVPILLAVSGGPDSLALLWSAAATAERLGLSGFAFRVVTVDHGLRAASAAEARHVGALAARLGLAHETLPWIGEKPASNLQSEARQARYDLLTRAAREAGAAAVMTAHHEDDQIETHFLAAARKAGDRGLAGMRPARDLAPGLVLLRPFLGVPGARLAATVAAAGLQSVDDPSNRDGRFARVRVRRALAAGGIDRAAVVARIAWHAGRRERADRELYRHLSSLRQDGRIDIRPSGLVSLERLAFADLPPDTGIDILDRLLAATGGAPHPPARDATQRLRESLLGDGDRPAFARTLGGVRIGHGARIVFSREFGRRGPAAVWVSAGDRQALFDGRFDVHPALSGAEGRDAVLAPLGRLGVGNAEERTLPVLLDEAGDLIAAPAAVLSKLPRKTLPLSLLERVSWRLFCGLPPMAEAR